MAVKKVKLVRGAMEFERVRPRVWNAKVTLKDMTLELPIMDHVLKFLLRDHRGRVDVIECNH